MVEHPRQGEVYWANLDPALGREIRKRRPVMIVSPDVMNRNLQTVIAAPITSTVREWPSRYIVILRGQRRSVALDQVRCLSVERLSKRIAALDPEPALRVLRTMFA